MRHLIIALLLLWPVSAVAQTTNSRTFSGTGTSITATGTALDTNITNGSLAVTGSVTVSGTVAATQSGTWTVQPGNTANTTAWKVDGSGVTQPVSGTFWQATQPVSGTFWQATQPISGTVAATQSGTWNIGTVTTLTGITNALPTGSNTIGAMTGTAADNSVNATLKLPVLDVRANQYPPSWTEGNQVPQSADLFGNLRINPRDSSGQELATVTNPYNVKLGGLSSITSVNLLADPTQATVVTLDPFGKLQAVSSLSDGSGRYAALRGKEGAQVQDAGLVVQESIAPNLQCPYVAAISQTANTQLVTNPGGQSVHVCSFQVVSSAAQNISLVEGTGSTCGTGTKGLYGGSTASVAFAANGGGGIFSDRIIIPMQVVGDNLCLLQSAANNVSGIVTYGIY